MSAQELITEHLDLWTGAVTKKSTSGRGSNGKIELTGIKKLRELILELAVRGKLLPQNQSDTPVSQLLEKVMAERESLVSQGIIKNKKPLPGIQDDEQPFELPHGWKWIRLGNIAHPQAGFAFKSREFNDKEEGLPLIRIRDVGQEFSGTYYSGEYKDEFVISKGDYLISMDGIFRVAQCTLDKALLNQRVTRLVFHSGALNKGFIATGLQLRLTELQGVKAYTTVDHLSGKQISEAVIGLPPEEEQHRIVQKVDELMALCDRLEQQTSNQLEAHETLVDTLLGTLTQSKNAAELADSWTRLAAHFDTLFTTEQSIDKLKQTILQLAVMGRLVEQDAGDEPAEQLIERIAAQKAETRNGKRRVSNHPKSGRFQSQPFQIPSTWTWVPLQQTGFTSTGKTPSTKTASFFSGDIPFIGPGQVTAEGKINPPEKHLSEEGILQSEEALPGDILTVCIGGSIGKTAIVTERCGFNQQLNKLRPVLAEPSYLLAAINADFFQHSIREKATGSATPIINRSKWESISIPLAPLAEQHRIVQKVDELMALCDQLKERLNQASETRCQLAEAVVEQGLSA